MPPPLKFYDKFWDEYESWPGEVQEALTAFLNRLQKNPNSPELLGECELDSQGRLAHRFHRDYVAFWKFERGYEGGVTDIKGGILKIDVLAISSIQEINENLRKRLPEKSPPKP